MILFANGVITEVQKGHCVLRWEQDKYSIGGAIFCLHYAYSCQGVQEWSDKMRVAVAQENAPIDG